MGKVFLSSADPGIAEFFKAKKSIISMGGTTSWSGGVLGWNQQPGACGCCDQRAELGALNQKHTHNKTPPPNSNFAIACGEMLVR